TSNPSWATKLPEIWLEYESGETRVARLVRQVDKLECLHQAYMYQKRQKGNFRLGEFKYLRERMTDPWLLDQANRILADWEALDASQTASTGLVFVIGGPGVGKGTQCTHVAKDFDFQHVSVGDLLRQEQDSPRSLFGDFIRESIRNSVIVPPSLTMLLLMERIQSIQSMGKGVLIDGFPRSVSQAVAFEQEVRCQSCGLCTLSRWKVSDNYSTIYLEASTESMMGPVLERSSVSQRDDDNAAVLRKRMDTFQSSNQAVLDYLSQKPLWKVWSSMCEVNYI
ncbi:Uridylate kinase, partial [Colletotrichum tanaceti]